MGSVVRGRAFRMRHARHGSHAARGRPSCSCGVANNLDTGAGRASRGGATIEPRVCRFRRTARGRPLRGSDRRTNSGLPPASVLHRHGPVQLGRRAGRRQTQRARPSFRARRQPPRIIDGTGSIAKGFNAIHYIERRNNLENVFWNTQEPWRGRVVDLGPGRTRGLRLIGARRCLGGLPRPRRSALSIAVPGRDARYGFARGKMAAPLGAALTTATASTRSTATAPRTAASNTGCPCARNATREPA